MKGSCSWQWLGIHSHQFVDDASCPRQLIWCTNNFHAAMFYLRHYWRNDRILLNWLSDRPNYSCWAYGYWLSTTKQLDAVFTVWLRIKKLLPIWMSNSRIDRIGVMISGPTGVLSKLCWRRVDVVSELGEHQSSGIQLHLIARSNKPWLSISSSGSVEYIRLQLLNWWLAIVIG